MDTQEDVSAIAASAAAAAPPPPHALTATGKPDGRRRCGACAGCASKGGRCDVLSKRWHANQAKRRRAEGGVSRGREKPRGSRSRRAAGDDDDDDESGNATSEEEEGGEAVEVGGGDADEPEAEAAAAARAAAALSARRRREDTQNSDGGGGGGGESGGGGGGGGGESGGGGDDDASLTFRGEKTYVDAVVAIEEKERAAATGRGVRGVEAAAPRRPSAAAASARIRGLGRRLGTTRTTTRPTRASTRGTTGRRGTRPRPRGARREKPRLRGGDVRGDRRDRDARLVEARRERRRRVAAAA